MSTIIERRLVNPFPGLRPFREDEEHFFFGRENQTDAMVDKLGATRFLAVVGSSGSGKSSLVNCGLRLALRSGLMASAGTTWRIVQFRPGTAPLVSMARALSARATLFHQGGANGLPLAGMIETHLRMSRLGLIDVVEQARLPGNANVLLVVDQFEELFRYRALMAADNADADRLADEAGAFVNLLLGAREQRRCPIHVVLTMRSDFLGDCTRFPGLAEAINDGQYLVPRMTREERKRAITGPIDVAGGAIAPVLLTRLVNDLGDDPDQLSILQHALNRIWARWHSHHGGQGRLNLSHYSDIGSMKMALDQHAEKAFAELQGERARQIAETLFRALTDKSTDTRGVRRPTSLAVLCELADTTPGEMTAVIDVFRKPSRSFLMPPMSEPLLPDTVVDIAHESLMRMWRRLVDWADREAQSTHLYRRLVQTASLHARHEAGLWRDPDLQLALEWRRDTRPNATWAARYGPGFDAAMTFLDDSRAAADDERERRAREVARVQELEQAHALTIEQERRLQAQAEAARVQRKVTRVVIAALLVSLSLAFLAARQTREAEQAEASEADAWRTSEAVRIGLAERLVGEVIASRSLDSAVDSLRDRIDDEQLKRDALQRYVTWMADTRPSAALAVPFANATDRAVLLLSVNADGHETAPRLLPAGEQIVLEGPGSQLWVARSTLDGGVLRAGTLRSDDGRHVIE